MPRGRRAPAEVLNPWAGYVDALSTLLMVIIFVLLVFVLAQAFLSASLSGRDLALDRLRHQFADTAQALTAEQTRDAELQASIARQTQALQAAITERESLGQQLGLLRAEAARVGADRDALRGERDRLTERLTAQDVAARAAQTRLDALTRQGADAEQARQATAAELQAARDEAARLIEQAAALRDNAAKDSAALDAARADAQAKDAKLAELGQKLDLALATKVEELQHYRSEFFGRLRDVLANQPGVQVVGDRFVFQSEVLFPPGGAELNAAGLDQIGKLAATLKEIAAKIPPDVNWLLRVDGHADRQPLGPPGGADNWDLSARRAIGVVHRLIADGIAPDRLAAAAFAENQPLDPADTPAAYAKNRRIEIRLTDR